MTTAEKQIRQRLEKIVINKAFTAGDVSYFNSLYQQGASSVQYRLRELLDVPGYDEVILK